MKTITIQDEDWKILTQMKLDRNFGTLGELISSLVREEPNNQPDLVPAKLNKGEKEHGC